MISKLEATAKNYIFIIIHSELFYDSFLSIWLWILLGKFSRTSEYVLKYIASDYLIHKDLS